MNVTTSCWCENKRMRGLGASCNTPQIWGGGGRQLHYFIDLRVCVSGSILISVPVLYYKQMLI
jgi:hypothetical protein